MAQLYLARKEYEKPRYCFYQLPVQKPKNAIYWNELGITLHNQSELISALKCYQKARSSIPTMRTRETTWARSYYERKKYTQGHPSYRKAISIRDDFAPFYLNLGYAYFGHKQYEDSIASFRKALQLDRSLSGSQPVAHWNGDPGPLAWPYRARPLLFHAGEVVRRSG